MGLGLMNKPAKICEKTFVADSEGFSSQRVAVLANIRVFVEGRHGSERWANLAAFSEATELFRFRKIPNLNIPTKQYIIFNDEEYERVLRFIREHIYTDTIQLYINISILDLRIRKTASLS